MWTIILGLGFLCCSIFFIISLRKILKQPVKSFSDGVDACLLVFLSLIMLPGGIFLILGQILEWGRTK